MRSYEAVLKVLSYYLGSLGLALRGKTVLELGSGTGLVGLVAAALDARVWITDQAFVLHLSSIYSQLSDNLFGRLHLSVLC